MVGGVEAELAIGLGEALDFAKHRQCFGVGLQAHVRASGDHQACTFLFAGGFRFAAAEDPYDLAVVLALEGIAHQHRLRLGAEVLHARRFHDEEKVAIGVGRAAKFCRGKRGGECGFAADFWRRVGGEHFLEEDQGLLEFPIGGIELTECGFCLRCKVAAGWVFDDLAQRADGFAFAAKHAVAIAGKVVAARALLGFFGVGRVAFEHRRGKGVFAAIVMIGRHRVGRSRDPLAFAVAVDQRAEATPRVIDHARLVMAVAEIPPRLLGLRIVGKQIEVIGEDHRRALVVLGAIGEIGRGLRRVVNVFPAKKQIVGRIAGQYRVDRLGARHLGDRGGAQREGENNRAGQHGNGGNLRDHCFLAGAWVAKEMFQMPAFWQVSITSTMRW